MQYTFDLHSPSRVTQQKSKHQEQQEIPVCIGGHFTVP